jgi:hypothetical protein
LTWLGPTPRLTRGAAQREAEVIAMARRLIVRIAFVVAVVAAIQIAAGPLGAAQPTPSQAAKDACKDGGWRSLTDDHGHAFRNQGECVAFKIHHPVSLADLTGSFTGTQSFTFSTDGCVFVHQIFDATYPGSATVGNVTLHIEGCVDPAITTYTGTFTISTNVGTVSGSAIGTVRFETIGTTSYDFDLTLEVASGTDQFAATTGSLNAAIVWPFTPEISGSVTT